MQGQEWLCSAAFLALNLGRKAANKNQKNRNEIRLGARNSTLANARHKGNKKVGKISVAKCLQLHRRHWKGLYG